MIIVKTSTHIFQSSVSKDLEPENGTSQTYLVRNYVNFEEKQKLAPTIGLTSMQEIGADHPWETAFQPGKTLLWLLKSHNRDNFH